jgi:hypothetical protein
MQVAIRRVLPTARQRLARPQRFGLSVSTTRRRDFSRIAARQEQAPDGVGSSDASSEVVTASESTTSSSSACNSNNTNHTAASQNISTEITETTDKKSTETPAAKPTNPPDDPAKSTTPRITTTEIVNELLAASGGEAPEVPPSKRPRALSKQGGRTTARKARVLVSKPVLPAGWVEECVLLQEDITAERLGIDTVKVEETKPEEGEGKKGCTGKETSKDVLKEEKTEEKVEMKKPEEPLTITKETEEGAKDAVKVQAAEVESIKEGAAVITASGEAPVAQETTGTTTAEVKVDASEVTAESTAEAETEEVKTEEIKTEDIKTEEVKTEEAKPEEIKAEDSTPATTPPAVDVPRYSLPEPLWKEIVAQVRSGLLLPKGAFADGLASTKSHCLLQFPKEGAVYYLDSVAEKVAAEVGADLIRIDVQDIAEIAGDYLGDSRHGKFPYMSFWNFE